MSEPLNCFNIDQRAGIPTPFFNANGQKLFRIKKGRERTLSPFHNHNYLQLWYVTKGSFIHTIHGHEHLHRAGDMLIIPPYVPHQLDTRDSDELEWMFIEITDNFLDIFPDGKEKDSLFNLICLRPLMYDDANLSDPFIRFSDEVSTKIVSLFETILEEYEHQSNLSPIYIRADLVRLLALIVEENNRTLSKTDEALYSRYRVILQDVLEYINQNYTKQIKLDDVCKTALMARSSFSYIFPRFTGRTFVDYLHHLRIRHAKKLLAATEKSITDVCMECGFTDVTHFGRVFKRIVGCSPREFIRRSKLPEDI